MYAESVVKRTCRSEGMLLLFWSKVLCWIECVVCSLWFRFAQIFWFRKFPIRFRWDFEGWKYVAFTIAVVISRGLADLFCFLFKAIPSLKKLEVINFEDCLVRKEGAKALASALKDGHRKLKAGVLSFFHLLCKHTVQPVYATNEWHINSYRWWRFSSYSSIICIWSNFYNEPLHHVGQQGPLLRLYYINIHVHK